MQHSSLKKSWVSHIPTPAGMHTCYPSHAIILRPLLKQTDFYFFTNKVHIIFTQTQIEPGAYIDR